MDDMQQRPKLKFNKLSARASIQSPTATPITFNNITIDYKQIVDKPSAKFQYKAHKKSLKKQYAVKYAPLKKKMRNRRRTKIAFSGVLGSAGRVMNNSGVVGVSPSGQSSGNTGASDNNTDFTQTGADLIKAATTTHRAASTAVRKSYKIVRRGYKITRGSVKLVAFAGRAAVVGGKSFLGINAPKLSSTDSKSKSLTKGKKYINKKKLKIEGKQYRKAYKKQHIGLRGGIEGIAVSAFDIRFNAQRLQALNQKFNTDENVIIETSSKAVKAAADVRDGVRVAKATAKGAYQLTINSFDAAVDITSASAKTMHKLAKLSVQSTKPSPALGQKLRSGSVGSASSPSSSNSLSSKLRPTKSGTSLNSSSRGSLGTARNSSLSSSPRGQSLRFKGSDKTKSALRAKQAARRKIANARRINKINPATINNAAKKAAAKAMKVAMKAIFNPKVLAILAAVFLMFMTVASVVSLFAAAGGGAAAAMVVPLSYQAEDHNINSTHIFYSQLEADLKQELLTINLSSFNEASAYLNGSQVSAATLTSSSWSGGAAECPSQTITWLGVETHSLVSSLVSEINHCPFELMAYLTVVHEDFNFFAIQPVVSEIFSERYNFWIETSSETRSHEVDIDFGDWEDHGYYSDPGCSGWEPSGYDPDTGEYDDPGCSGWEPRDWVSVWVWVEDWQTCVEYYEWYFIEIHLTAAAFEDITLPRLNADQLEHYEMLMYSKGGRWLVGSPFDFNWLPLISSHFGWRVHPITGLLEMHSGIDIALPTGTHVVSTHNGTVVVAQYSESFGNWIAIEEVRIVNGSPYIIQTRYAHLDTMFVNVGDEVMPGDIIGAVGSTGYSTGSHLHFEVVKNGAHLNPAYFAWGGE